MHSFTTTTISVLKPTFACHRTDLICFEVVQQKCALSRIWRSIFRNIMNDVAFAAVGFFADVALLFF